MIRIDMTDALTRNRTSIRETRESMCPFQREICQITCRCAHTARYLGTVTGRAPLLYWIQLIASQRITFASLVSLLRCGTEHRIRSTEPLQFHTPTQP